MIRQAVLLLGGRGTRLWPLTATVPKGLLPLAGLPFVEYQLRLVHEGGIEEVLLAVGKEHQEAWATFIEQRAGPPELQLAVEEQPLDTAGQVVSLAPRMEERFLVLNGDVLFDASLPDLLQRMPEGDGVLVLARVEDPSAFGVVVLDAGDAVERFVEKPPPGTAPADTVSAGMYLFRRQALAGFGPGPVSFERQVFPALAQEGRLKGLVTEGLWVDIGTPGLYIAAHGLVLGGHCRLHRPDAPHQSAEGAVVAGQREGAWSWVGPHAVVDEGAVVAEAVLLDGAHIHSGARVEGAVVGWDSRVLPGAGVAEGAVVGRGCEIGPECELARGVRVGPGASLGVRDISFSPPP